MEDLNHNFTLINCDTDSIMFCKQDQSEISKEERSLLLKELNSIFPDKINWEDDGYFSSVLVIKAKNYVLKTEDGKIKYKGSALKSSKLEPALKEFQKEVINCFLEDRQLDIINIYNKYIKSIYTLIDIQPWCSKRTITDAVLTSERTNESKIRDAVEGIDIQMGDKVYLYFDEEDKLKRPEQWKNDHNKPHMCERVWKTLNVFVNVLDMKQFPKFHLKKSQKELLPKLLGTV